MNTPDRRQRPVTSQFFRRLIIAVIAIVLILFVPAGTVRWLNGWVFLLVTLAMLLISVIYLRRVNPEIIEARRRIQPGTKRWDRVLLAVLFPVFLFVFITASLDSARFAWSRLRWPVIAGGYVLYLAGFLLTAWAEAVNRFFEPGVRIQIDRGHTVIDTGPYAFVRHPGYVAALFIAFGAALALGSLWALIPAGAVAAIIVVRTVLEDRTLQNELAGYREYTRRVRFRLIPGLW